MKSNFSESLLSTAYLPPVEYMSVIYRSDIVEIEQCENYQKQSYRSRCHIYSANGPLPLIIPVERSGTHSIPVKDIRIDYSRRWQQQHWRAIVSAYRMSPFFEYYEDDFAPFYTKEEPFLFDFNTKLTELLLSLTGIRKSISFTEIYRKETGTGVTDFRELIHPKRESLTEMKNGQYHQVFAHKSGFIPNLSSLDLLFNEGPDSISYL